MNNITQRYRIDTTKSDNLYRGFRDNYNHTPYPTRKKIQSRHRLKAPHRHVYKVLIQEQAKAITRAQVQDKYLKRGENLPTFFTNCCWLAEATDYCSRQVRNILNRLKKAGVIVEYIYHGPTQDFELRLNPEVIFLWWDTDYYRRYHLRRQNCVDIFVPQAPGDYPVAAPAEPVFEVTNEHRADALLELFQSGSWPVIPHELKKKMCAEVGIEPGQIATFATSRLRKKLPKKSNQLSNQLGTNKLKISASGAEPAAETAEPDAEAASPQQDQPLAAAAGNSLAGNEPHAKPADPDMQAELEQPGTEIPAGDADTAPVYEVPTVEMPEQRPASFDEATAHLPEPLRAELRRKVSVLYGLALRKLYDHQGTQVYGRQREEGMAGLAEFFCYHYSPAKWGRQYAELRRRIELCRHWIDNNGRGYTIALPNRFFDVRAKRGMLVNMKNWYAKDVEKREQIAANRDLNKARKEYERAHQKNNRLDPEKVYQKWYAIVKAHGGDHLNQFINHVKDFANDQN